MVERHVDSLWRQVLWTLLAAVILAAEFATSPNIHFALLYAIPVVLASLNRARRTALVFAGALPLGGLLRHGLHPAAFAQGAFLVNAALRIVALVFVALWVSSFAEQRRELRILRGFLPICGFCKKIRGESGQWTQFETFIAERSEAKFTHTFCPECGKKHYGDLVEP